MSVLLWEENFDLGRAFRHSFRQAIDFHIKLAKERAIWDKILCTLLVMHIVGDSLLEAHFSFVPQKYDIIQLKRLSQ